MRQKQERKVHPIERVPPPDRVTRSLGLQLHFGLINGRRKELEVRSGEYETIISDVPCLSDDRFKPTTYSITELAPLI